MSEDGDASPPGEFLDGKRSAFEDFGRIRVFTQTRPLSLRSGWLLRFLSLDVKVVQEIMNLRDCRL